MTDKQMTLSDCSGCLHLASCKTPSGSFLFHKVHDYFSFVVLQLSFMSRVFLIQGDLCQGIVGKNSGHQNILKKILLSISHRSVLCAVQGELRG